MAPRCSFPEADIGNEAQHFGGADDCNTGQTGLSLRLRQRLLSPKLRHGFDVFRFGYIEMIYNPKRKHTNNGLLSLVDFEAQQQKLNKAGV